VLNKFLAEHVASQQLGAALSGPHIWDLLLGIGTCPEKFLHMPLSSDMTHEKISRKHLVFTG